MAANTEPAPEAPSLARRLRELREYNRLTQSELGQALGSPDDPLRPANISMWESPASGRVPSVTRIEAYAQLFCTPRSFEGQAHMLSLAELTPQERDRMEELRQELLILRANAESHAKAPQPVKAQSMWHFPDRSRITLVCYRLQPERRPPSADPGNLNYVRLAGLADLDTLVDIYGEIRAYNPTSRVVITAAQDLTQRDVANHLVLIGGLAWKAVMPWFSRIFPIPIEPGDPAERDAIVVNDPDRGKLEFKYALSDAGELLEDVGFFARGENPSAPLRTLTICGGITTRGVRGAARCFIDREMRERNEQYLMPKFPAGSTYCIVMKVPVLNKDPLTPDLSKDENRLYEWCDAGTEAG